MSTRDSSVCEFLQVVCAALSATFGRRDQLETGADPDGGAGSIFGASVEDDTISIPSSESCVSLNANVENIVL